MPERFVPLAAYLRAAREETEPTAPSAAVTTVGAGVRDFARADIVHEVTILRIAALEAFERVARRTIAELAHDVLGRELACEPAEIDALVARALAAFGACEPLALAVSEIDRERVRAPFPIRSDPALVAGDLVVYVRDGAFESTFAFRLSAVLARDDGRDS